MKSTDTLKDIVSKKKERLLLAKQAVAEEELKAKAAACAPAKSLVKAINKPNQISLIAEIKQASPSMGLMRQEFDPVALALAYQEAGAQAISVLTEEDHFRGSLSFLAQVRQRVELPLLRKDFIIDPYQVYESRAAGADAILLIADLLSKDTLGEFMHIASEVGLECLIEAHTEKELKKILGLKPALIGINNRDLHTLEVDPKTIEKLFLLIPKEKVVVAESGIAHHQDVLFLKILGVKAVLVGSAFMQAPDIKEKVLEVMGW
jgi:indole-3-glycerol phosphate synthase